VPVARPARLRQAGRVGSDNMAPAREAGAAMLEVLGVVCLQTYRGLRA
jgi:hypothetical protein